MNDDDMGKPDPPLLDRMFANPAAEPKTEATIAATKRYYFERSGVVPRIRQMTGKCYPKLEVALANLPPEAVMEMARLLNDLQCEVSRAKRQAIHEPWRR